MYFSPRQTGRTTRMLMHAIGMADSGQAVYVLSASREHAATLKSRLCELDPEALSGKGIKVETPMSLRSFDWETMRSKGMHSNCRLLVDHYAIEYRFLHMLNILHAYDLKE